MGAGSLNGFNWIAPVYDAMARLVYGKAIRAAQLCYLDDIPPNANVLIIGGGTGWILDELFRINNTCTVCYIEASSRMLEQSRRRLSPSWQEQVTFIHGTQQSLPPGTAFDVVITHFFLDLFNDETLDAVIKKIQRQLTLDGQWLVADFVDNGVVWQRMLLASMYTMFNLFSGIEAQRMPNWPRAMEANGLRFEQRHDFYKQFIRSVLYTNAAGAR